MKDKKMWAFLANLGAWEANRVPYTELPFDQEIWDYIVEESEKCGINTIVIDIGGGIEFASHPELTLKGAWSRKKLRDEMAKCKEKNITLIPKLNFATTHSVWLGEYGRMISTNTYYRLCNDLIKEAYELFDHPAYIHLGMDEEDAENVAHQDFAVYRQGELFWHDLRFLIDCVKDTGAKPWIWACPLFNHFEEYKKHIDVEEALISPWYYNAFRKEHWTPITSRQAYVDFYSKGKYADMGLEFVEEDPFFVKFRELALPLMKEGYQYVPCASVVNRCDYNTAEIMEYFKEGAPDDQIIGFITAPWKPILIKNKKYFEESFKFFKEAKEAFYSEV